MTDPRDPRQVKQLDRTTMRRLSKAALPATLILDDQEKDELCDLSNQSARDNHLRRLLLGASLRGGERPRVLDVQERLALELFVMGEGPRPRFARLVSPDGHYGAHWLRADDPDAPRAAAPWPETLDGDPSRYVRPKGDYGIPGVTV